jgi:hypothetical protein
VGKRGKHYAAHFHASASFEVVGLCDVNPCKPIEAAPAVGDLRVRIDSADVQLIYAY